MPAIWEYSMGKCTMKRNKADCEAEGKKRERIDLFYALCMKRLLRRCFANRNSYYIGAEEKWFYACTHRYSVCYLCIVFICGTHRVSYDPQRDELMKHFSFSSSLSERSNDERVSTVEPYSDIHPCI